MKRISIAIALMMVALLMGCNLELVDTSIFDVVEEENQAGLESGFAGGNGTEENPYLISTEEQLLSITDQSGNYFALANDIEIKTAEANIASFSGVLDGRGHRISFANIDPRGNATEACGFILSVNGASAIKNLVFEMNGIKSIVLSTYADLTFENVTTTGNVELIDNNVAGFLVYAESATDSYTITFERCVSAVNYIDDGTHYGSHFYAYYPLTTKASFVFRDCTVTGSSRLSRAGVLFGNSSQISTWGKNVTVENLVIEGEIYSTDSAYPAGIISWGKVDGYEISEGVVGNDNIVTAEPIQAEREGDKIKFIAPYDKADTFDLFALPNILYVNSDSSASTGWKSGMHRSYSVLLGNYPKSEEIDVSMYGFCDESYAELPDGLDNLESFESGEKTLFYVANTEKSSYEHAYFGSSDKSNVFTKDSDGIADSVPYRLVALDAEGNIIGVKSFN